MGIPLERDVEVLFRSLSDAEADGPRRISACLRVRTESPGVGVPFLELLDPLERAAWTFVSSVRLESSVYAISLLDERRWRLDSDDIPFLSLYSSCR